MKKTCLLLFLIASLLGNAQINDIAKLSTGKFKGFKSVYDHKQNLFGYFVMFDKGFNSKKTRKFEIVLMDKNLNKMLSNEWEASEYTLNYRGLVNHKNELVLFPEIDPWLNLLTYNKTEVPKAIKINLKTNTLSDYEENCFGLNGFEKCPENQTYGSLKNDTKTERKSQGFNHHSNLVELADSTFLVYEYKEYKKTIRDNRYIKFDKNKQEVWKYEYNKFDEKSKKLQFSRLLQANEDYLLIIVYSKNGRKEEGKKLIKICMKTGKKLLEFNLDQINNQEALTLNRYYNSFFYVDAEKTFNGKTVMVGKLLDKSNEQIGFYRLVVDQDHKVTVNKAYYTDFSKDLKVNKKGYFPLKYFMAVRDMYFTNDGSVGILFEKFKIAENFFKGYIPKTTDLIYVNFNKDFKITSQQVLSKNKSKNEASNYLFSQYLNNGNDVVFFYYDKVKDEDNQKVLKLYINKIIEGKYTQENINLSSKDNFIYPYVAKEGYILLNEMNKNEVYNQIRLERINL